MHMPCRCCGNDHKQSSLWSAGRRAYIVILPSFSALGHAVCLQAASGRVEKVFEEGVILPFLFALGKSNLSLEQISRGKENINIYLDVQ